MGRRIKHQLGYHIAFGNMRNSSNQVVGIRSGFRIYTDDPEFINDLLLPVDALKEHPTLRLFLVKYRICDKETKETLAYLDIRNNIFNLNGDYIGSIRNYVALITFAITMVIIALVSTFFAILAIRISRGDVIDSEIVVSGQETAISDSWEIFGEVDEHDEDGHPMIYPGSRGEYIFSIENVNDINVSIIFQLKDKDNQFDIPLVYKLSDKNGYICGDEDSWVKAEDLEMFHKVIGARDTKTYKLEWMWDGSDDELDTLIGMHGGLYHLHVEIISTITNRKE